MLYLNFPTKEETFATYAEAAARINRQFGQPPHKLDPKDLMNMVLAAQETDAVVNRFYLALRIARAEQELLPNPVIKES